MCFKRYMLVAVVLLTVLSASESASVKREVSEFADFFNSRSNGLPEASIVKVPCKQGHREIGGKCRKVYYR